nr:MAG TPA: NrdH [Caudoviricetes sp.]
MKTMIKVYSQPKCVQCEMTKEFLKSKQCGI